MQVTSPTTLGNPDESDATTLREAPNKSLPPARKKMDELMGKGDSSGQPGLAGPEGASPLVQSMMAVKGFEMAARQAVAANPDLSPMMAQILMHAKQSILSGVASLATGGASGAQIPPPGLSMGGAPPPGAPPPVGGAAVPPVPVPPAQPTQLIPPQ